MKSSRSVLVCFTLLLLGGSFLWPLSARAESCACYFGEFNNCSVVPLTRGTCQEECTDRVGSNLKEAQPSNAQIELACTQAAEQAAIKLEERRKQALPPTSEEKIILETLTPDLNVEIPGLKFTPVQAVGSLVNVGFIGDYISGIYRYLIGTAVFIAIIMVMVGGLQYAFGAVSQDQLTKAKTRIRNAIFGLILLLSAAVILQQVNPQLISPKPISIETIGIHDITMGKDSGSPSGTQPPPSPPCAGKYVSTFQGLGKLDMRLDKYACGKRDLKKQIKFAIIHEGAWGGDTINVLETRGFSTHYVIRKDGEIVQTVDIHKTAFHAGYINAWAVGIDMELPSACACMTPQKCRETASKCIYTEEQYASLRKLLIFLIQKTGIKLNDDQILGHCQLIPRGDPRNFNWEKIGLKQTAHRKTLNAEDCERSDWEKFLKDHK